MMHRSVQSTPPQQPPEYGPPWPGCDVTHCPCVAANLPCQRQAALQTTMERATADLENDDESPPMEGLRVVTTDTGEVVQYQTPVDPFAKADRWRFIGWTTFTITALLAGSGLVWLRHGRYKAETALLAKGSGRDSLTDVASSTRRVIIAEDFGGLIVSDQNKQNVPNPHFVGLGSTRAEAETKARGLMDRLFSNAPLPERLGSLSAEHHAEASQFFASFTLPAKRESRFLPEVAVDIDTGMLRPLVAIVLGDTQRALITRLQSTPRGEWLLDWPMLLDSIQRRLTTRLSMPTNTEPFWCTLSAKRRSGIAEEPWERENFIILECSTDGSGDDKQLVLVPKTEPLGSALEKKLQFGLAYIGNAHLQIQQLKGGRRLVLLDFRAERQP